MFKLPSLVHLLLLILAGALLAPLIVRGLFGAFGWAAYALSALVCIATVAIGLRIFRLVDDKLAAQVVSVDGGSWVVRVNGVTVGNISEQLRATIRREALHDPRLAVAQVTNVLMVPLRVVNRLMAGVPLLAFWLVVSAYLFYPQELHDLLVRMSEPGSSDHVLQALPTLLVLLALGTWLPIALGYRFGLRNVYSEFVADTIRRLCDTPAEGDVTLWREERIAALRAQACSTATDDAVASQQAG